MSGYGQSSAGGSANVPNPLPVSYPALLTAVMAVTAAVVGLGISNGTVDVGNDGSNPVPVVASDTVTVTCTNCGGGGSGRGILITTDSIRAHWDGSYFFAVPYRVPMSTSIPGVKNSSSSGTTTFMSSNTQVLAWPKDNSSPPSFRSLRLSRSNNFSWFRDNTFYCLLSAQGTLTSADPSEWGQKCVPKPFMRAG